VDKVTDKMGQLLLTKEDWLEKNKHRFHPGAKPGGSGGGGDGGSKKNKAVARSDGGASGEVKLTSEGEKAAGTTASTVIGNKIANGLKGRRRNRCKRRQTSPSVAALSWAVL
jgi:hypothetical protein